MTEKNFQILRISQELPSVVTLFTFLVTYKQIPIFKPTNAHMYYVQGMQGK